MSSTWKPKPRPPPTTELEASQWPKAVGSRPAQPHSPAPDPVQNTESLGAYTYYSRGNPSPQQAIRQRVGMTGLATTYRRTVEPQHVQHVQHEPSTPTVYQPVTPPSSPPSSLPGQRPVPAAPPRVPVITKQRVPPLKKEIKSPPAANLKSSKVSLSTSRSTSPRCICHRDHCKIICYICGKTQIGRVRMQCPEHPNTIHLMDYDRCPDCKGVNLTEMRARPH
ncbi:CASP-like protein 4A1 [Acanthaster planci]|uniref:CASP-like protein 4A1 n=1 Tax=Acanthaster planci TaxID=133434 RepID=A0A8B7XL00_ACAPL|nr:CASP-like protein 4A1 [Acanthaster planci]